VFRVARLFMGPRSQPVPPRPVAPIRALDEPERDPYYEAAMRELDAEIERR
jgi:hypothetical protein